MCVGGSVLSPLPPFLVRRLAAGRLGFDDVLGEHDNHDAPPVGSCLGAQPRLQRGVHTVVRENLPQRGAGSWARLKFRGGGGGGGRDRPSCAVSAHGSYLSAPCRECFAGYARATGAVHTTSAQTTVARRMGAHDLSSLPMVAFTTSAWKTTALCEEVVSFALRSTRPRTWTVQPQRCRAQDQQGG